MELVFEDASVFKRFIDGIAVLVDEAEFIIDDRGMVLKATDPSQISLVDFELPKSSFKSFNVPQPSKIGLDLNYFNQIMGRAKSSDSVHLALAEENSKLAVTFSGASKRKFLVPLLDLTSQELPTPKIDFDAELKIKADALQDSFKDAGLISTHIVLAVENNSFIIRASSSKGNLENIYSEGDKSVVSLKARDEARAMFPLEYLSSIVKAASSDTDVVVKLKTNAPVELEYYVGGGRLKYFLAPRIEDSQ